MAGGGGGWRGSRPRRPADEAYRAEVQKWRDEREARLKADGGWLSVAGLFWLKEGENRFGTDPAGDIVLPEGSAPAKAGVFELKGEQVTVALLPGASGRIGRQARLRARRRCGPTPPARPTCSRWARSRCT